MELRDQLVPAVILLIANLMSGPHGSKRYEVVTAVFGWLTAISVTALLVVSVVAARSPAKPYLFQICAFSFITAMARDYEKYLRRLFPWNR
jgi:hypothetical protein